MKVFIRISLIGLIIFIASFIIIQVLIMREIKNDERNGANINNIDYVIVLGARLYGKTPSPALYERLEEAFEYISKNDSINIVVTGGQGANEDIPEAEAMKKFLVDRGVEENRIIIEDKSTSTYENLKFAKDRIQEIDGKEKFNILIVTSDFHLLRSKLLAKRLGFNAYGLPAKTPESVKMYSYTREYFAIIKSLIFD